MGLLARGPRKDLRRIIRIEPIRSGYDTAVSTPGTDLAGVREPNFHAPDLIEPAVAYRNWRAIGGRLRSPYLPVFWDERVLPARCRRSPEGEGAQVAHFPPHRGCTCGVHAYHEPDLDFPTVDYQGVAGIVTVWGRVEIAPDALRAEFARVEALGTYSRWSHRQQQNVAQIAARLGVDLVDMGELAEAAARYGQRLAPASLHDQAHELERIGAGARRRTAQVA
jgi:hypothetical protein